MLFVSSSFSIGITIDHKTTLITILPSDLLVQKSNNQMYFVQISIGKIIKVNK